jgi:SHS2 domain-containing protein
MAVRPTYREIEHTADVGVELTAPTLPGAFEQAAAAMFDLICDLDLIDAGWTRAVRIEGRDIENLLVRWLTELLFIHESERVLLSAFGVTRLADTALEASVAGEPFDRKRHPIKLEIKAPTYHDLRIVRVGDGVQVRVIFDT